MSSTTELGDSNPGSKRGREEGASGYLQNVRQVTSTSTLLGTGEVISKEALETYYTRLYPLSSMFSLISYGSKNPAESAKREYCVTMRTADKEEVFVRYECCPNKEALRKLLKRDGLTDVVLKLDIGPVYNTDVRNHKSGVNFVAEEKELVFDIDMDEYDDVRRCCSGKQVCSRCWQFLTCAIKVIDATLREDFGFRHILFVYSGRRGVHCWVFDKQARQLNNHGREAVASYVAIATNMYEPKELPSLFRHPSVNRSVSILQKEMPTLIENQGIITYRTTDMERFEWLSSLFSADEAEVLQELKQCIHKQDWEGFQHNVVEKCKKKGTSPAVWNGFRKIILKLVYPRLDIEVSKQTNHLLKAPFCVHPATGRVCVPIDLALADAFDPTGVPTLAELLNDLKNLPAGSAPRTIASSTALAPHLEYFRSFVANVLADEPRSVNAGGDLENVLDELM